MTAKSSSYLCLLVALAFAVETLAPASCASVEKTYQDCVDDFTLSTHEDDAALGLAFGFVSTIVPGIISLYASLQSANLSPPPGPRGQPGVPCSPSDPGPPGPPGPTGMTGLSGLDGLSGIPAPIGLPGDKGESGESGDRGDTGDKGDAGMSANMVPVGK